METFQILKSKLNKNTIMYVHSYVCIYICTNMDTYRFIFSRKTKLLKFSFSLYLLFFCIRDKVKRKCQEKWKTFVFGVSLCSAKYNFLCMYICVSVHMYVCMSSLHCNLRIVELNKSSKNPN